MPIFAGLITSLFGGLAGWFSVLLSARLAMAAAAVVTFGVLTTALFVALTLLFAGLVTVMPAVPGVFSSFVWMVVTDNALACVAVVVAADALVALFHWNLGALKYASGGLF